MDVDHRGYRVGIHQRAEFPADLSSARTARRFVESELEERGYDGDVSAVVWMVSELATNAVIHGEPPHAVVVDLVDDVVHVSVEDGDIDRQPSLPPADADKLKVGGHGLKIVASLADDWGWHLRGTEPGGSPCGKAVWFTIGSKEQSR